MEEEEEELFIDLTIGKKEEIQIKENDVIIFGIDPGTVNCGICKYNVTKREILRLDKVSFRKSIQVNSNKHKNKSDTDLGNAKLLDSVAVFILKNYAKEFENTIVFIEDQNKSKSKEVWAIQYGFQCLMGSQHCVPVSPHAVKSHFSEYFPAKRGVKRDSEEQYRYDKKNATKYGRNFVPHNVRTEFENKTPKNEHNHAYDAYWVARFAAERLLDRITGERICIPPKKRKRSESNSRPRSAVIKQSSLPAKKRKMCEPNTPSIGINKSSLPAKKSKLCKSNTTTVTTKKLSLSTKK